MSGTSYDKIFSNSEISFRRKRMFDTIRAARIKTIPKTKIVESLPNKSEIGIGCFITGCKLQSREKPFLLIAGMKRHYCEWHWKNYIEREWRIICAKKNHYSPRISNPFFSGNEDSE